MWVRYAFVNMGLNALDVVSLEHIYYLMKASATVGAGVWRRIHGLYGKNGGSLTCNVTRKENYGLINILEKSHVSYGRI